MSRKDTVNSLFMMKLGSPNPTPPEKERERVRTGAVSAMGASLQELTEGARAASKLKEQIASGMVVVDLDPAMVDGSMVNDRLIIDVDPDFQELVASIRESGQQVPILVRPHPENAERYQVAYGHRRLRAAQHLGIPVKAVVQPLSDNELVIAQGKENLDRKDLSYIEKALFARRLEEKGFDRVTIMAALSTDKADLSRYIAVARMIPESLLNQIGPAPKAGRARWLAMADRLTVADAMDNAEALTGQRDFLMADSDGRFVKLFDALAPATASNASNDRDIVINGTVKAARLEARRAQTSLVFNNKIVPEFGEYVAAQLDQLYLQFLKANRKDKGRN
ncbi:plasmid partitioning protein RepB [Metarhizobium album]|uniref:Plasmid partitioning protein RepB n=1 Tax=Metarhizobium album TaxID=2182425 RepID=A0A2U2DQS8_9HYPH|nr:plasmid partitioning protein RepB [Rhizobium album]PWE55676.1 plasmid partitioning protein RepB [Rhizobium album]